MLAQLFDVFQNLPALQQFDVVVSNPPYVDAQDMAALTAEFLHEPDEALAAGADGLDIVRQILQSAADYLTDHGILVVEVGNSDVALLDQYPGVPFNWPEFSQSIRTILPHLTVYLILIRLFFVLPIVF